MGLINVSDIRAGMILAGEVKDRNGRVLLASGQEITDKHLKIFKMWGVSDANIQGVAQEDVAAQDMASVDAAVYQEAEQLTKELFLHAGTTHPAMNELARLLTMRHVRQITEGRHGE